MHAYQTYKPKRKGEQAMITAVIVWGCFTVFFSSCVRAVPSPTQQVERQPDYDQQIRDQLIGWSEKVNSISMDRSLAEPPQVSEPINLSIRTRVNPFPDESNTLVLSMEELEFLRRMPNPEPLSEDPVLSALRTPENLLTAIEEVVAGRWIGDSELLAGKLADIQYLVVLDKRRMPQIGRVTRNLSAIASLGRSPMHHQFDLGYTPCRCESEAIVLDLDQGRMLGRFSVSGENRNAIGFNYNERDSRSDSEQFQAQLEADAWRELVRSIQATGNAYFEEAR